MTPTISSLGRGVAEFLSAGGRRNRHQLFSETPLFNLHWRPFQRRDPRAFTLFELFFLNREVARVTVVETLGEAHVAAMVEQGAGLSRWSDRVSR